MAALLQWISRIQAFSIYRQFFHGHCCWFQIWRQLCLAVLLFSRILKLLGERLCIDVGLLWASSAGSAGGILPSWRCLLALRTRLYATINGALCFAPRKWCVFEGLFEEFLKFKIVLSLLNPSDVGLPFLPLIFIDACIWWEILEMGLLGCSRSTHFINKLINWERKETCCAEWLTAYLPFLLCNCKNVSSCHLADFSVFGHIYFI